MPYGLGPGGFTPKPRTAILEDIESKQLDEISPSLDVKNDGEPIKELNSEVADELVALWAVAAALYDGIDPDVAADDQLVGLALITGTAKQGATKTQVLGVTVNVATGTYAAGAMFASVEGTNNVSLFVNKAEVVASVAGDYLVDFEAVNAGPVECLATKLNVIAQPLSGWNSVSNSTDGVIGSAIESDSALRLRRREELSSTGTSTADAIKGDVLIQMQPPTTTATTGCTVLYNNSDSTDANGLPPKSIEVIALSPGATSDDDVKLATLILNQKAAGVGTHGTSSKVVKDSQGNSETIYYTRPSPVDISVAITVLTDETFDVTNGPDQIKAALLLYANGPNGFDGEYQPGVSVYRLALQSSVIPNPATPGKGVQGVIDVTVFHVDTSYPATASANIPITIRQMAVLDTSRIDVAVT